MFYVHRDSENPFLTPDANQPALALAAFNPSPVKMPDGAEAVVFRAMSKNTFYHGQMLSLSTIMLSQRQSDGQFGPARVLITPVEPWERFGCEDPRVTQIDDTYYIFYTAIGDFPFKPDSIRVAVAISKDLRTIQSRHLVTPFNAKAMALFPERINGKYAAILTVHSDLPPSKLSIIYFDNLEQIWSEQKWAAWYSQLDKHAFDLRREASDHAEVGAVPIRLREGWLLVYSHIQDYFTDQKIFGIEAALLDESDPTKIIKQTKFPFMVPESTFERYGNLPNIIFPSGASVEGDDLTIYYGACDTYSASAKVKISQLLHSMSRGNEVIQHVERFAANPILSPVESHDWESNYVLNPAAIDIDGVVHIFYRAIGHDNTSVAGLATSRNGTDIDSRFDKPAYVPRAEFESKKAGPGTLSGCEDARIMQIDDRLHITYTAYNGVDLPRVATSSIKVKDFVDHRFEHWSPAQLISPDGIDDKDAAIFSEPINGEYMVLHRVDRHVCADFVDSLDFSAHKLDRCIQLFGPRPGMWDHDKVGIAGPPIKTKAGWLLFYHGISRAHHYMLGAVLLDLENPTQVIGRTSQPIMTPVEKWEVSGWVPNVVFPCGQVVRDGLIYLYYGGADAVIGVATIEMDELLENLS